MTIRSVVGHASPYGSSRFSLLGAYPFSAGSLDSIRSITLGATSNYVSFQSIPQTYKHLHIRCSARNASGVGVNCLTTFNEDVTASYSAHQLGTVNGTTLSSWGYASTTSINDGLRSSDSTYTYAPAVSIIDIIDYSSTSKTKIFRAFTGYVVEGLGIVLTASGAWYNNTAITSIQMYNGNGFSSGSTFHLYGIRE